MKRYIPIVSILFFALTANQPICGEESRFLITYLFPAQHPDNCEVLWITDPIDANSTEFTLRPIDSTTSWYAPNDIADSINNSISAINQITSVNRQNRLLTQIFTKTWGEINLHRTSDYGSVLICPVKGDFAIRTFGDTDVVSCINLNYDPSLWDTKLAQILKTADLSNFDFLKFSLLRRQQPIFEPVRPSCVIDTALTAFEEGDFWLFEFEGESCCDNWNYGAFVAPADSVRPPYFTLTPFLMDDTFACRLDDKSMFSNSKLIQVFTKTWVLCNGKFEHVLVTAIPLHGRFKRIIAETDNASGTPIYIPVGEYTVKRELWDTYGQASINFVDYSNFDYRFDEPIVDQDIYDALE
ncbi:MAG: hypothetical protein K2K79_02360 [Paramuribaculum sp.]|nr:hypothetical protein [Paramuribaculum sp.]